jgi:hypothetical protein
MRDETEIKLLFDTDRFAVGCVLLQAALGGNPHIVSSIFDTNCWIVGNGFEKLQPLTATISQWRAAAAMSAEVWKDRCADRDDLPKDWEKRAKRGLRRYKLTLKNSKQ